MNYYKRMIRLIFGLFLCAVGLYLTIQANIGLAPWEAFTIGLSYKIDLSYGDLSAIIGIVILVIDFLLKEKIGVGTLINTVIVGKFVDLINYFNIVPIMQNFWMGIGVMLLGQFVLCIGCYFYMSSELGCGPRDSLMVALGKRIDKVPIGIVKGLIEFAVLILGWMLGAKIGLGTVMCMFGISFIMQLTFNFLKFDVKALKHEDVRDTWNILKSKHITKQQAKSKML